MPYKDPEKRNAVKRAYRLNNPELVNTNRRKSRILRQYGLTQEGFDRFWDRQGGRCAICRRVLLLGATDGCHIDHDHNTGAVRGLLCGLCNKGLGMFRDNRETLLAAVEYLKMSEE